MSSTAKSRAKLSLPIDGNGKRFGYIVLPWSRNDSAWGSIRIPVAIIANGSGPTVLLTGGNHGDEFEGPITISEFVRKIELDRVRGTIICIPALNYPAVKAGKRLSPIDNGNMNRAFRGRRDGTITEQIAHFVEEEFVSRADAVLDVHAGGRTMMFHPLAVSHELPDAAQTQRAKQALLAFGAPIGLVLEELDSEGMLDSAVESRGKLFLSTELGGGGSTTPGTLRIARSGMHNFLVHVGVLDAEWITPPQPTRLMTSHSDGYIVCEQAGLIEYVSDLGEPVRRGDPLARIYDIDDLEAEPHLVCASADGVLLGRFHGGLTDIGDFLALIGCDV
jgi:N2-acetyl-L-2,4-diaminobutanoate deacetylase